MKDVEFEVPSGPNMDAVVDAFDNPTADFTDDVAKSVAVDAFEALGIGDELGAECDEGQECSGPEFLVAALGGLVAGASGEEGGAEPQAAPGGVETRTFELNVGGVEVEADGFAEITRICPGVAEAGRFVADAVKNGEIRLTSTFGVQGIDPVVWGTAAECILGVDGVTQKIDAALNLFVKAFEEGADLEGFAAQGIVFDMRGSRAVGDAAAGALNLAFEVNQDAFRILVPQGDEHLVLLKEGERIAFHAANGLFQCSSLGAGFLTGACQDVQW